MKVVNKIILIISFCVLFVIITGCTQSQNEIAFQIPQSENVNITPAPSQEEEKSSLPTSSPTIANSTQTPELIKIKDNEMSNPVEEEMNTDFEQNSFKISSPLQGITLEELQDINSNPFVYLGPGKDEGHHGTDFSFYQYKSINQIEQLPVLGVFSGVVRSVVNNRPPYGNMIIIETPMENFSEQFQSELVNKENFDNLPHHTNLNCPEYLSQNDLVDIHSLSLYTLYAHLFEFPEFSLGQTIINGTPIGKVGNSGLSGNPHLHLEFRIGPSNFEFEEMAHYDNSSNQKEMENYCLWRVSGFFYQIDPMDIFQYYLQNR